MQPYIIFYQGSHTNKDMAYGDSANATDGDIWVPFVAVDGDTCAQHYDYAGASPDYTLVYAPPIISVSAPQPNPMAFFASIQTDGTLSAAEKGILAQYFGTLTMLTQVGQTAAVQAVWQQVIAAYGPTGTFGTWLTAALQTLIQNYASAANISLV